MAWADRWKTATTSVIAAVTAPIAKALAPKRRTDPWIDGAAHQRDVNRRAGRRRPNQDLIDAIDDAHRGRPRWLRGGRGWLDRRGGRR